MKRFEDWPRRLHEYLEDVSRDRFEWGRRDCALFAADAVQAMTGEDLAADFRGRYRTDLGAKRVISNAGFQSLEAVLMAKLGDPVPVPFSGRGDVVLVRTDDAVEAVGVIDLSGERVAVLTLDALESLPIGRVRLAWSI